MLTWTVMMLYVHLGGRRPSRVTNGFCFGLVFAIMMFTFVGINLLKWGLHRY